MSRTTTYCLLWNEDLKEAVDVVTPEQAKARDEQARSGKEVDEYTVVFGDPALPDAYIVVNWFDNYVGVWFTDAEGRPTMDFGFRELDGRMFLDDFSYIHYPPGAGPDIREALAVDSFSYQPDGYSKRLYNDKVAGRTRKEERRDGDFSESHWAEVPSFEEITYDWIPAWVREGGEAIRASRPTAESPA